MLFLVNPKGTRGTRRTRKAARTATRKRKASPAQMAARRAFALKYGNAGTGESVKAQRTLTNSSGRRRTGGTMAVRKRSSKRRRSVRRTKVRANAPKRRRRKYHAVSAHKRKATSVRAYHQNPKRRRRRVGGFRRNPVSGIVGQVIGAAKDVATIVVGKAATNYISRMVPFGGTSKAMTAGKKIAIAIGLSMLAKRVTNQRIADLILAGGMLGPVEDFASTLPIIGTALASDTTVATTAAIGAYYNPALGALPAGGAGRFSAIGRSPGMGSYVQPGSATGGGY